MGAAAGLGFAVAGGGDDGLDRGAIWGAEGGAGALPDVPAGGLFGRAGEGIPRDDPPAAALYAGKAESGGAAVDVGKPDLAAGSRAVADGGEPAGTGPGLYALAIPPPPGLAVAAVLSVPMVGYAGGWGEDAGGGGERGDVIVKVRRGKEERVI